MKRTTKKELQKAYVSLQREYKRIISKLKTITRLSFEIEDSANGDAVFRELFYRYMRSLGLVEVRDNKYYMKKTDKEGKNNEKEN